MIRSFRNRLAEDLFFDRMSSSARRFPSDLKRVAQRKLQYLNAAIKLQDLLIPPGNRLEALKGDRKGFHSIRVNDQWRVTFRWEDGGATDVAVEDYH